MTYKKGDVINHGNYYRLILATLEECILVSGFWEKTDDNKEEYTREYCTWFTQYELEKKGWTICTPEEAGLPVEQWVPKVAEDYFFASVLSTGAVEVDTTCFNKACEDDRERLAIGNIHRTKEEAIAWAKKRYNV